MGENMNVEQYRNLLRERLSEKRFLHCINVSKEAVFLAHKYGADEKKAELAGLLHDIMKEAPDDEQNKVFNDNKVKLNSIEKITPKLWHAISGAYYIKNVLKIDDNDIFNAVRYHTTGRKNMSLLEKIIFVADFTSFERDYEGVEEIRKSAYRNIDSGVMEGLSFSIYDLAKNKRPIHNDTIEAYNNALLK